MDECHDRNHKGLERVMLGDRLPDASLGQDVAFLAFVLGGLEALVDRLKDENETLKIDNERLRGAIAKHREATGHNMCWENDEELHAALEDGKTFCHTPPPRCEFRQRCKEYYESRQGAEKTEDGW